MIDAMTHALGYKPGLTLRGDEIVEWPYSSPIPTTAELESMKEEYERHLTIIAIKKKAREVI